MKKIILLSFLYLNLYAQELDIQSVEIIDTVIQTKIIEPLRLQGAPQTIQVLDAKTLEKRQVQTLHDAVKFVPGVYAWATYGETRTTLGARGYRDVTYLREGIPLSQAIQEMQGVEELYFLKGSAALLFGQVNAGGTYYVYNKNPFLSARKIEVGTQMQGFTIRGIKPFLDLNLPLSSTWALRVNAAYQHREGIRNYVDGDRYYIQPSVLWQPNKNTQFVLNYEFLHDRQRPDNGAFVLIPNYLEKPTIYNPGKDKFFGFQSDKHQTQQQVLSAKINHTINEYFTFQQQIAFADERIDYYKTANHSFLKPILSLNNIKDTIGYNPILQRKLIQQDDKKQMYYLQTDLIAKNLKHHRIFNHGFQVGLDATYLFEETQTYIPSKNIDEVNIFTGLNTLNDTPMSNSPQDISLQKDKLTLKKTLRMSTMLQYQLAITQYVKLIAGGRWTGLQTMNSKDEVNNGWTPLAGIVLYPSKQSQVFFTYTNTFVPSTLRDENSQKALGNDYHTQLELGAKWAFHDKIEFGVTAYQISVDNQIVALVNAANVLSTIYGTRVGSLLNRGLELEMVAKPIQGLELLGGYSFVDARYVKSDKLKDNAVPFNTPKNTFYLWADYFFNKYLTGLSIGLGGNYVGTRYANDQIKVPYHNIPLGAPSLIYAAYFQLDARAGYVFKQFSIDLRANNLNNVINYTSYRTQYVNQIDPIHFILTLRYKI